MRIWRALRAMWLPAIAVVLVACTPAPRTPLEQLPDPARLMIEPADLPDLGAA